jgi:hypothetical protein
MKINLRILQLTVISFICFAAMGQTNTSAVPQNPAASKPLMSQASEADSLIPKKKDKGVFIRFAAGISSVHTTYTSELVTATTPHTNLSMTYLGSGYAIPLDLFIGFRYHAFKIGIGLSEVLFHVSSLSRTDDTLQNTTITGAAVKHQVQQFGKDLVVPVFVEYTIFQSNTFCLDANMYVGGYYPDLNAYTGGYASSGRKDISGMAFAVGLSPTWKKGPLCFFVNPGIKLNTISYHRSTRDDLTQVYLNLSLGCTIQF